MNIGLFFGSFNPITLGHLEVANNSLKYVDEVWFILSPQNPLKNLNELASFDDRAKMIVMSIRDNNKFKFLDIEKEMELPSYTIKTLDKIKELYPGNEYSLIFGTDVLNNLHLWESYDRVIGENKFVVVIRDNKNLIDELVNKLNIVGTFKNYSIISSTIVRNLIKDGKSIRDLVHSEVNVYLDIVGLYK